MAAAEDHDDGPNLVGELIEGRYRLTKRLGGGTVGSVYRADDLAGGAPLAIKVWHSQGISEQAAGRFHRETKALGTLEHPNIVAIRDYGLSNGTLFLAMELLEGMPLEKLVVTRGALPIETALSIVEQVLQALAYAHALKVVHRDLKPDNVFLTPQPGGGYRVKLLDYGLAKFLEARQDPVTGTLTKRGTLVGTPLYMAPEQALGRPIDTRTDVYAVGCILFEMLAGQPPFMAESLTDLLRAHLAQPVPRLSALRPDLPHADLLQTIVDRALAKQTADRFADGSEMLLAVSRFRQAEDKPAARPSPLPPKPAAAVAKPALPGPGLVAAAPVAAASGRSGGMWLWLWALATMLGGSAWWFLQQ